MKMAYQTEFYSREEKWRGNCFAACIASFLEISIEDVPWPQRDDENWSNYWPRVAGFVLGHGFHIVHIQPALEEGSDVANTDFHFWSPTNTLDVPGPYYIANGPGPRGVDHSVIMRDGKLEHDPHPSGDGLLGIRSIEFLVTSLQQSR